MTKIKLLIFLFFLNFLLFSCGGASDIGKVMRNEKLKTNDEFLIKKQEPLSQPPDFDVLPVPGSKSVKKKRGALNSILNNKQNDSLKNIKSKSTSTESSIMKQIKQ